MSRISPHLCVVKILSVLPKLLVRRQKSASFINCSWHMIAEFLGSKAVASFLTDEKAHLYSSQKMSQPGAYYTFLLKAGFELWIWWMRRRDMWLEMFRNVKRKFKQFQTMRYYRFDLPFIWRRYRKEHISIYFKALCQTLPFKGRKAIPRAAYCIWRYSDSCSCMLWSPTSVALCWGQESHKYATFSDTL